MFIELCHTIKTENVFVIGNGEIIVNANDDVYDTENVIANKYEIEE